MQKLNHFDHVFMPVEEGVYLVKCSRTGGEFSSILLVRNNQKCPCCGEQIK